MRERLAINPVAFILDVLTATVAIAYGAMCVLLVVGMLFHRPSCDYKGSDFGVGFLLINSQVFLGWCVAAFIRFGVLVQRD